MSEPLYTSRREFVAGSLTFLSVSATMPVFLGQTARALAGDEPRKKPRRSDSERILVVVQLAGGNDGLNTVVPYEMDGYYKARRQLAIGKGEVLKLEKGVGLHPSADGLKALYDDGCMAVIQGVGYPNPNRSHFTSMDIWQTADPSQRKSTGWIGRYFDACCKGDDPGPKPVQGVAMMQEAPIAMMGERFFPLSFDNPDALAWRAGIRDAKAAAVFRKLNNIDGDLPSEEKELARFIQRAALEAQVGADEIRGAAGGEREGGPAGRLRNRGQLGRSLNLVLKMIERDMPTRIYYLSMGGFDTHTGQAGRHRQLLSEFGDAMKSFMEGLRERKLQERVLVMSFSEFGRRVEENASGGTDHGEAAPMFLFGSSVRPGVHEDHPSLDKLHRGDLSFGCDFRRVYATVLQHWLKTRPEPVIGAFAPMNLIRTG